MGPKESRIQSLFSRPKQLRLAEFDALFATAVRKVDMVGPTHARMQLTGRFGLAATVQDLTVRETDCCSFFTFTVRI